MYIGRRGLTSADGPSFVEQFIHVPRSLVVKPGGRGGKEREEVGERGR